MATLCLLSLFPDKIRQNSIKIGASSIDPKNWGSIAKTLGRTNPNPVAKQPLHKPKSVKAPITTCIIAKTELITADMIKILIRIGSISTKFLESINPIKINHNTPQTPDVKIARKVFSLQNIDKLFQTTKTLLNQKAFFALNC